MSRSRWLIAFLFSSTPLTAFASDWKPVPAPLMTKWGKQVTPDNVWKEYPRPQLVRKDWQNLNGLWDYAIVGRQAFIPEENNRIVPRKWDGQILVPFCILSALSGVGKQVTHHEFLWYRRTVETPVGWKGKRVLLHFEAVDWESVVFVNGKEIGNHNGGFDPFSFDITDALKEGMNEVAVRVWDPTDTVAQPRGKQVNKPGGIWYTPVTGIWQTVWMEPDAPQKHMQLKSIRFTPNIDKGEVEVLVENKDPSHPVYARVKVEAIDDQLPNFAKGPLTTGKPFRFKIPKPRLWTPDDPYLYEVTVHLTPDSAPGLGATVMSSPLTSPCVRFPSPRRRAFHG